MGVELFEHAVDGIFGELLLVDAINIQARNGYLRHLKFFDLFKVQSFVRALRAGRQGQQQAEKEG